MKLVKRLPPQIRFKHVVAENADFLEQLNVPEVQELVQHANDQYLFWDDFMFRPMPEGVEPEQLWAYLSFLRSQRRQAVDMLDKQNAHFHYWIPDRAYQILNSIDRWSGETIGTDEPHDLPPPERYVISSLMEEAIASSQLEGASTTRKIAKQMLQSGRRPINRHEQMIFNNWITIQHLRQNKKMALTPDALLEIHAMLTHNTMQDPRDSGNFRTTDDISVYYDGEIVHQPPLASLLPERIKALCAFANSDTDHPWIHPVIKAIILHFWIGYDHPFVDGNGRTARAVFYWYLLSKGYWLFEYLSVSRYFLRSPAQYTRAYVYTEIDENDLTYFITYNLRVIQRALQDLRTYLDSKQKELAEASALLRRYPGLNFRQRNVVAHALRHPYAEYTVMGHKNLNNIAYETARKDLLGLAKRGLLKKDLRGRTFVFAASGKIVAQLQHNK